MKIIRKTGSTSQILQIFIQDSSSTTGAGLTGLTNASSGLVAYYHRDTDTTATAISLVSMTVGTFTSSGFKEIDSTNMPGWYQLCPPNVCFNSGASSVAIHMKGATNMVPLPIEIDLASQVDVVAWNGTAVSTPATAGIPEVNVKNVNNVSTSSVTTVNANVGTTQPLNFTGTGASATAKSDVVNIAGSAVSTSTAQVGVNVVNAGGTAWGSGAITAASIATGAVDADALATDAVAEIADGVWDEAISGHLTAGSTGAALNAAGSAGDPWSTALPGAYGAGTAGYLVGNRNYIIRTNTAQAGASTTITLDASASSTNDFYNGTLIYLTSGTGAGQSRYVTDYVGSTKVATINTGWATNPDNTSVFVIVPAISSPTAAENATAVWETSSVSNTAGILYYLNPTGVYSASVGSSTSTTVTAAAYTSFPDDVFIGWTIVIKPQSISNSKAEIRTVTDFVGSTGTFTVDRPWTTNPSASVDSIAIYPSPGFVPSSIWDTLESSIATSNSIGVKLKNVLPSRITKNTALSNFEFLMVDSTDHVTPKTGLSITATRSIDGAAFASCANSASEVANGVYKINLAASDLNGNVITLKFTASGADQQTITIVTQTAAS